MAMTDIESAAVSEAIRRRTGAETPRPSDPGGDEDVPDEREIDQGREDDARRPAERPPDSSSRSRHLPRKPHREGRR